MIKKHFDKVRNFWAEGHEQVFFKKINLKGLIEKQLKI